MGAGRAGQNGEERDELREAPDRGLHDMLQASVFLAVRPADGRGRPATGSISAWAIAPLLDYFLV